MSATQTSGPRPYRSPLRQQRTADTRASLLLAARDLFTTKGWVGTAMRDVAATAGVATETLYAHFASKTALFQAAADLAVVGDERPIALADREEFARIGVGSREERIAAAARVAKDVNVRTAPFAKVLREAAHSDEEIAAHLEATRTRQRRDVTVAIEMVIEGPADDAVRDGVWAITSPEVYLLLVETSGWTPEQYEAWLVATLLRLLPARSEEGRNSR
jgi:AcrR family transcriptional regulator